MKVLEERNSEMIIYPSPHLEKLEATLTNDKLPKGDRSQIEKAIGHYKQWIKDMDTIVESRGPVNVLLEKMVLLLNQYRVRMDIDLIFNSQDDWLYRQKGQLKLDNSVIEEFLPRLVHPLIIPEIAQMNVKVGPVGAFAATWFDSSLIKSERAGGLKIRSKDQDFAISMPLYLKASHFPDFHDAVTQETYLAYIAAECKTNLDKTMFQEACATARDLKTAIPSAKYFLLCEWLDMKPISSTTTPIDEVLILRKAKRISSNIRGSFSTFKGRQAAMSMYIDYLNEHPYRTEVFERFIGFIRTLLRLEVLDEDTVLERGYF
jgi:hypothetical protein